MTNVVRIAVWNPQVSTALQAVRDLGHPSFPFAAKKRHVGDELPCATMAGCHENILGIRVPANPGRATAMARDNTTSQSASQYDGSIAKTIPNYQLVHKETLDLVKFAVPGVRSWLDTGCGTGSLILQASQAFGGVAFVAADPSEAMLEVARVKLSAVPQVKYIASGSEELCCSDRFDVVTAILAHHYLDESDRQKATRNCFQVLNPGGIYITVETILPNTEQGKQIGLQRWRNAQITNGKAAASVDNHLGRYGTELKPITIEEHLKLLRGVGFSTVEVMWAAGMQAGFYGIK